MDNKELEEFLFFESKKCFDYKIDNILIWKYLREFVYDQYIHKIYNTENRVAEFSKIKFGFFFIGQLYKIFSLKDKIVPKDILFLVFPRKTLVNQQYYCTQLQPLIDKFKNDCWILENPFWIEDKSYLTSHFTPQEKNMTYTDKIEIRHRLRMVFLNLFKGKKFKTQYYEEITSFCDYINKNLGININVDELIKQIFWYVSFEKYASKYYEKILKQLSPKCLIEVYTPNHQIALLNTVAHKLGIPVIDIQHGAIGNYEPIMYSYYQKRSYAHLSDYIFVFGDYWKRKSNFHVNSNCVIPVGIPFLENNVKKMRLYTEKTNTIVIISQARYSKLFYDLALTLQRDYKISSQNKILLKLHPYEYSLYKQGYYKNLENEGIQVAAGLNKHLYDYFRMATCVIGVNSTALYEALAFNKPIYIYKNKYGTENLVELSNSIPLINIFENIEMLIEQIKNMKDGKNNNINYIFSDNAMERMLQAIKQICNIEPFERK